MKEIARLCLVALILVGAGAFTPVWACSHTGTTRKCIRCLRENYLSYGKTKAAIRCDPRDCPLSPTGSKSLLSMEAHKHCGLHGSVVTLTKECPECAKEEAKQHWKEAEIAKQEDDAFKKLGIPLPGYRDGTTSAKRAAMIQQLNQRITAINQRIEDYENRMFQPNMSSTVISRLEKKIAELEFTRDIYQRALEQWEAVTIQAP